MKSRKYELVKDIANQFGNLSSIGNQEWIRGKDISIEEIEDTFETCEVVLKGFLAMPTEKRHELIKYAAIAMSQEDK